MVPTDTSTMIFTLIPIPTSVQLNNDMELIVAIQFIFWLSFLFIIYTYFGYPVMLGILAFLWGKPVQKGDVTPSVSFIITAYNEERLMPGKIENTLAQDYPKEKLEIIVASDCSTDKTDQIVQSYKSNRVSLVRVSRRLGKENAQKHAIDVARGEILVFSDVATILDPSGVRNIVMSFNDATVGCVSSVDRFLDPEGNVNNGEGVYVRYEMFLRKLESKISTLVGLSGSFFAARKEVCQSWATDRPSDFNTLINSVKHGYRGVCDGNAVGYYRGLSENSREFNRKVRTVVRGLRVFMRSLPMVNVCRYGLFSWQLISHKLCRWTIPFALALLFVSNVLLAGIAVFYSSIFLLQTCFYVLAIIGSWSRSDRPILRIPSFFLLVNLSILVAWYKYIRGAHYVVWEPSIR